MADTVEGLAEMYFSLLKVSTNAGVTLAQFYGALFKKEVGRSEIIAFNRLLKIFSRSMVFFALIDISRKESFDEFPFGLLYKICRDKLEAATQADILLSSLNNLDRRISEMEKDIAKVKKIDPEKAIKYLEGGD